MGCLRHFDLGALIERYGTSVFVETGTGLGDGLRYAAQFPFRRLYSVEIVPEQARRLAEEFRGDHRIAVHAGSSVSFLAGLLPGLEAGPVLFWMDAHYPGGDLGLNAFDAEPDPELRLPLRGELRTIRALRPGSQDVLLIDDLRIYAEGPYAGGNLHDSGQGHLAEGCGCDWIYTLFEDTHQITPSYAETGYLVLLPRSGDGPPARDAA